MCELSATIRDKPNWWEKCKDPAIRAKWKEEAATQKWSYKCRPLQEDEIDYVLDELEEYAAVRDSDTGIEPSCYRRIWQSDNLIESTLRESLVSSVASLENVPDAEKDWHPRANEQVLDLVHPSLYCIVYDRTLIRNADGSAVPLRCELSQDDDSVADYTISRFSWLPTDFLISLDGKSAKSLGYINSIHPRNDAALRTVIETLVARFIPLWSRVLAESKEDYKLPLRTLTNYYWDPIDWDHSRLPENPTGEDYEVQYQAWKAIRTMQYPRLLEPYHPDDLGFPEPMDLNGRKLQVIIKLANILLTPEKPVYEGGSWHVEGMKNECIVSTGIYYYDQENISQSKLSFRVSVAEPESYDQDDEDGHYGRLGLISPLNQVIGSVSTKAGRCIAFPNMYQHCVSPFSLLDPSKPGYRKIIALFLVDPELEVPRPSTTNVPPQRRDWWSQELLALAEEGDSLLGRLPTELLDLILDFMELMTREEAEELRLRLMDERTAFISENNENMFDTPFNMCEH
ncbi:uncharacterized protein EV420DRAFT_1565390 [Desarmillaria tabescens]|uniref:Uncharacterized protein n=1 Tax=Armillaria tabescens TaxID=1929756 RepID=A0AA39JYA3_ARMTA|nr:uncharacterized protein EV420DRAFT_1565390 [Desarmillaria tabescens]KAK0449694.1 hypothetical protein EV420DRAFT_1565390 [Desarmillaria tabescens]